MDYEQSKRTWPVIFYLSSILLANLLVDWFGIIHVGWLVFPAGAVAIGLTFSARDLVQRQWGKWGCWIWMIAASLITLTFNWHIALASMGAFLVAETADWAVYTMVGGNIRERMFWSNLIGTPLDSVVFVMLAFGPVWPAMWGQTLVKFASSLLVLMFVSRYQYGMPSLEEHT